MAVLLAPVEAAVLTVPVGPVGPVAPVEPVTVKRAPLPSTVLPLPRSPSLGSGVAAGPVAPVGPVGPVAPVAPFGPVGPVGPGTGVGGGLPLPCAVGESAKHANVSRKKPSRQGDRLIEFLTEGIVVTLSLIG